MQMVGRKWQAGDYRYGFNGKENDNEVKGEGNQQDYGMRIYDTRLGRFLSVDPITRQYPWLTPYQFASNSPISSIDLDGLEGLVSTGIPVPFSKDNRPSGMVLTTQDAAKINRNLVVAAFKAVFSEPLPKKLIDHYANENGKPYALNKTEAVEIKSYPTGLQGLVATDNQKFQNLLKGAKKGDVINLPQGYSIQGGASTAGTLGRFTIKLTGTITVDKKDASKWTFEGTMQFSDVFDFETAPVTANDLQRSDWGNLQTDFAKKYLPGQGFVVTSDVINVKQTSSDATFDWYNGKKADGKQNRVSNEMSDHPDEGRKGTKEIKEAN